MGGYLLCGDGTKDARDNPTVGEQLSQFVNNKSDISNKFDVNFVYFFKTS